MKRTIYNLLAIIVLSLLMFTTIEAKDKPKPKEKKLFKTAQKSNRSVPVDGGLTFFLIAAGAAGISFLRKKEK